MNLTRQKVIIWVFLFQAFAVFGKDYQLKSPDGNLSLTVKTEQVLNWSASLNGQPVIINSPLSMTLSTGETLGQTPKVVKSETTSVSQELYPEVPRRKSVLKDEYTQLSLKLKGNYTIVFRAYNYGVAYRFETNRKEPLTIQTEQAALNFAGDMDCWFPEEESMLSHNERLYLEEPVKSINDNRFCSLPVLFENTAGINVLFTEADLFDYPCMFLYGTGANSMKAGFPKNVLEVQIPETGGDRDEIISKEAGHIAQTAGTRTFPWRVCYITTNHAGLFEHDLVYQLSRPSEFKDASWIKPGQVAWDWWNANNIYGVDFKSGLNTETYKYYIDFASEYGLEYIILDEGWSKTTTNVKETAPEIDIRELVRYGNEKNVGVILWLLWKPLDQDMEAVLDLYQSWGIKGIKVDFMQRSDQYMVNYYERVARETAKRRMLVDFHGAFKPSGLQRAYPNFISNEGLKGMENCKWATYITPAHNVTLPFIRMAAGPMDYTPGAMDNAQPTNFCARFERPMSIGTRCHQIAMYVVYESPLQMLSDSPSNYYREKESTEFISKIPVTWDDTRYLAGKTGEYIALARKKGDSWYIGVMNNEQSRQLELDLSFLGEGEYSAEIMQDGPNAERNAEDYIKAAKTINGNNNLTVQLSPGGGWAAILSKKLPVD